MLNWIAAKKTIVLNKRFWIGDVIRNCNEIARRNSFTTKYQIRILKNSFGQWTEGQIKLTSEYGLFLQNNNLKILKWARNLPWLENRITNIPIWNKEI